MGAVKIVAGMFFGLAAGVITSAGFFSILTSVGVINRLADVTKSQDKVSFYEDMVILGATFGNIVFVFQLHIPCKTPGAVLYGLLSGMFLGLFAVCLAETLKALPIFARRIRVGAGLGVVILAIALGKAAGHLLYYFKLYG